MSEYWKSNPRKFCDFCKCWISDNKPSVEFHEKGKRHKENVQKKLQELSKRGKEDHENQLKRDDYMKEMEEQALKAYKKDIEVNPDLMGTKLSQMAEASNATIVIGLNKNKKEKEPSPPVDKITKKWKEVKSPEGSSYYWNTDTGETVWDVPKVGFISLDEQNESLPKAVKKSKKNKELQAPHYGPMPRAEVYSSWQPVGQNEDQVVDLQLPEVPQEDYYAPVVVFKRPEISFREKVVTLSGSDACNKNVSFKKRKTNEDHKKNMRKRVDDSL